MESDTVLLEIILRGLGLEMDQWLSNCKSSSYYRTKIKRQDSASNTRTINWVNQFGMVTSMRCWRVIFWYYDRFLDWKVINMQHVTCWFCNQHLKTVNIIKSLTYSRLLHFKRRNFDCSHNSPKLNFVMLRVWSVFDDLRSRISVVKYYFLLDLAPVSVLFAYRHAFSS